MNRIVLDHDPTAKRSEDMRRGREDVGEVRVPIETVSDARPAETEQGEKITVPEPGLFSRFKHLRRVNFTSDAEVDAHMRALRDKWSDRDR